MILITAYKALRKLKTIIGRPIYTPMARLLFYLNGATIAKGLKVRGFLHLEVTRRGQLTIGEALHLNSGHHHNVIGRQYLEKQGSKKTVVCLADNVFIGAHSTILKGVAIGENSVIGRAH
jgi:acetyltransferase-like isoleucine patch superfamily enzyme